MVLGINRPGAGPYGLTVAFWRVVRGGAAAVPAGANLGGPNLFTGAVASVYGNPNNVGAVLALASGSSFMAAADGTWDYVVPLNSSGTDEVTYNGDGGDAVLDLSIPLITAVIGPAGTNGTVTTPENTPYVFAQSDFGFQDVGIVPSFDLNAVEITTLPTTGTLADNGTAVTAGQFVSASDITNGLLAYTPAANTTGTPYDSFTFQVQDTGGTAGGRIDTDPNPKTLTVNVSNDANQAPSGTNAAVSILANSLYTFATGDFGFSDPNSPANNFKAVEVTTLPSVGTLTKNGVAVTAGQFVNVNDINLGLLVYAPAANASGNSYASFTFQVQNDGGTANGGADTDPTPRTLGIQVAQAPAYSLLDNSTLDVAGADAIGLFANASNFNPSTLAIASVNGSSGNVGTAITTTEGGTLTVNADGGFDYTPATNFTGSDSFTYTYSDGTLIGSGTATLNVAGVAIYAPTFTTPYNQTLTGNMFAYTNEPDSTSLIVSVVNGSSGNVGTAITTTAGGSVTVNADGSFSYTPPTLYTASDSFDVTIGDGASSATATVNLALTDALAGFASFSNPHDQTLTVAAASGLLTDSSDADNNPLTVAAINGDTGNVAAATTTAKLWSLRSRRSDRRFIEKPGAV